jgi:hypothetical protein
MSTGCIAAVFRHSESKGCARLVMLAMADEANDEGWLTAYRRSQGWLAKKANVDRATVRRAIDTLVELGEVEVLATGDGRESSDYRLHLTGIEGVQDAPPAGAGCPPRGRNVQPQGVQDAPPIIPFSPVLPQSLPTDDGSSVVASSRSQDRFEDFWRVYPRHVAKSIASRAWKAACKKADPAAIIAGAERYASEPGREMRFTAHPATWLRAERWLDESESEGSSDFISAECGVKLW